MIQAISTPHSKEALLLTSSSSKFFLLLLNRSRHVNSSTTNQWNCQVRRTQRRASRRCNLDYLRTVHLAAVQHNNCRTLRRASTRVANTLHLPGHWLAPHASFPSPVVNPDDRPPIGLPSTPVHAVCQPPWPVAIAHLTHGDWLPARPDQAKGAWRGWSIILCLWHPHKLADFFGKLCWNGELRKRQSGSLWLYCYGETFLPT